MNDEATWGLLNAISRLADETRDIRHAIEQVADELCLLRECIQQSTSHEGQS